MDTQSGFRKVTRDVLDLVELQIQLLFVDSQEAKRKATTAVISAVCATALAGSGLTTAMIAGGFILHESFQWTVGWSLFTVAGTTFVIVIGLLLAAMFAIKAASAAMSETKSEFVESLKWIKATLVSPETSPRNQVRSNSFDESSRRAAYASERF